MKQLMFAAVVALMCAGARAGVDYYVNLDPSSVLGYDSSAKLGSAANPFPTIQQAIQLTGDGYRGDSIHIANGHYHLNGETISVTPKTSLVGESRDGVIIDGDGLSRCIKTGGEAILRNLTVTNGFLAATTADVDGSNYGAGVWAGDFGLVSNCVIRGCFVRADAEGLSIGGAAIFCQGDSVAVRDSVLEHNVSSNNFNNAANASAKTFGGAACNGTFFNCQLRHNRGYLNRTSGYNYFDGGAAKGGAWYGCLFTSNVAVNIAGAACARGGAIALPSIVSNCFFIGNMGDGRGTAVCAGCPVINSSFIDNCPSVDKGGAALLLEEGGSADGCWFEGNTASSGVGDVSMGVALGLNGSSITAKNCVFYRNVCNSGNAILAAGASDNVVSNCFFIENTDVAEPAVDTCLIGTVSNQGHEIRVMNCIVTDNIGQSDRFYGVKGTAVRSFEIHNCLFARNKFVDAIYLKQWDAQHQLLEYYDHDEEYFNSYVSNCTIVDNWLSGKAVYLYYSTSNGLHGWYDQFLRNCLIYGNYSDEGKTNFADSQLAYAESITGGRVTYRPWWQATNFVVNCAIDSRMTDVANLTNALAATIYGNHDNIAIEDPKFTDAANGDYTLRRASPCIGAGTNMTWCASAVALNGMTYERDPAKPGVRVFCALRKPVPRVVGAAPSIGCCEYCGSSGLILIFK